MRVRWVVRRGIAIAACCLACLGSAGCSASSELPPRQAFALSASALSGRDRFTFEGETVAYDASGRAGVPRRYRGEVSGHRTVVLNGEPSSGAAPLGWNYPLALADAVQKHAAEVAYGSSNGKAVVLTVTLRPDAARRRMQEALRAEWSATGSLAATLIAASSGGKRAGPAAGEEAEGRFREALATLEASTVCRWTADRRTWFPLQLKEETVLRYTIAGKAYVEKRSSVTSFRARLDSDTIGRSEGMKPLSDR